MLGICRKPETRVVRGDIRSTGHDRSCAVAESSWCGRNFQIAARRSRRALGWAEPTLFPPVAVKSFRLCPGRHAVKTRQTLRKGLRTCGLKNPRGGNHRVL